MSQISIIRRDPDRKVVIRDRDKHSPHQVALDALKIAARHGECHTGQTTIISRWSASGRRYGAVGERVQTARRRFEAWPAAGASASRLAGVEAAGAAGSREADEFSGEQQIRSIVLSLS